MIGRAWRALAEAWRRRRSTSADDDLDEELQDYVARAAADRESEGRAPDEAQRLARASVGSPAAIRDHVRDVSWGGALGTVWQDVRYGVRLMRRGPWFAIVAILVLAIGIGANVALFSVMNALFFAPLRVSAPGDLLYVYRVFIAQPNPYVGYEEFAFLADRGKALGTFASHGQMELRLSLNGDLQAVRGEVVSGSYFSVLGVVPAMGRTLGPDDDESAATPAIVISHEAWMQQFGSAPDVVGSEVRAMLPNGVGLTFTIVGVAPPGFRGLNDPWTPSRFWIASGPHAAMAPIVRLKSGVTIDQFHAFLANATTALQEMYRRGQWMGRVRYAPVAIDRMRFPVYRAIDVRMPFDPDVALVPRGLMWGLVAMAMLVLAVATANIAGLLLARGVSRAGELAVRRALGAGGVRLARQLATESALLAAIGGALGLVFSWNVVRIFVAAAPAKFAALDVRLDWRVLGFTVLVCAATGLLVGLAPIWQASQVRVVDALGVGVTGAGRVRTRLRHGIVVPQVALSLILLIVAAVHVRALIAVERADPGYRMEGVWAVQIDRWRQPGRIVTGSPEELSRASAVAAAQVREFRRIVLDAVRQVPDVVSAAFVSALPVKAPVAQPANVVSRDNGAAAAAFVTAASDDYFETFRIPLIEGRPFDHRDDGSGPPVAIISRSMARAMWPEQSAVGRSVALTDGPQAANGGGREPAWLEVVGVVADVAPVLAPPAPLPRMYVPVEGINPIGGLAQRLTLVVRGGAVRSDLASRVRAAVRTAGSNADVLSVQSMRLLADEVVYPRRVAAGLLATAGLTGLILAALGLYGVTAYSVAQRRRELGIRVTLGANGADLVKLVLAEGARVFIVGGLCGAAAGIVVVRLTAVLLPGLPLVDMFAFIGVPIGLGIVVLIASYLPARRAARVDPVEVLKAG